MNETQKTLSFVGAGLLILVLAFLTRPAPLESDAEAYVGEIINKLDDPAVARGLEVIKFDEATATRQTFTVSHNGERWVIPSHDDYPADAETQMADAATSVMNREILGLESDEAGDHALYGVVDPGKEDLVVGAEGVGVRVTMTDENGRQLTNVVVGKEVQGQEGQRYVREVDKDAVFVVNIDPGKLSTEFEDWIEDDLLKLSPFDIDAVTFNDYSSAITLGPRGLGLNQDPRSRFRAEFNREDSKWELTEMEVADPDTKLLQPAPLTADEELQQQPLNDLKTALDDLKIIDVARKPPGLSADLQASQEVFTNDEAYRSLAEKGFYGVGTADDKIELLSSEGEAVCLMRDGLEYVLRFGKVTDVIRGEDASAAEGGEEDDTNRSLGRYILVTTRVNLDKIPPPDLKPLPAAAENAAGEAADESTVDAAAADSETAQDASGETAAEAADESATEGADDATAAAGDEGAGEESAEGEPAEDAETPPAAADSATEVPSDDDPEAMEIARKAIQEENDRRQQEYDDKVAAVQQKVDELNARFADWYYIISDDTYKKVHLGREDIVAEKEEPAAEADALEELNTLEAGLGDEGGE